MGVRNVFLCILLQALRRPNAILSTLLEVLFSEVPPHTRLQYYPRFTAGVEFIFFPVSSAHLHFFLTGSAFAVVVGKVTGTTPASLPVLLESLMLVISPTMVLVMVTTEPEASRSSWSLKLVHRSSNLTDCTQREGERACLGERERERERVGERAAL